MHEASHIVRAVAVIWRGYLSPGLHVQHDILWPRISPSMLLDALSFIYICILQQTIFSNITIIIFFLLTISQTCFKEMCCVLDIIFSYILMRQFVMLHFLQIYYYHMYMTKCGSYTSLVLWLLIDEMICKTIFPDSYLSKRRFKSSTTSATINIISCQSRTSSLCYNAIPTHVICCMHILYNKLDCINIEWTPSLWRAMQLYTPSVFPLFGRWQIRSRL